MASVSTIIRKDKINKQGNVPIYFRIIKNRKPSYISSGISIPMEKWDDGNKRVKAGVKNSARLNSYLTNKFTEIQDTVFEYETISKSLTSKNLKEKAFGKKPVEFFPFADAAIQRCPAQPLIDAVMFCAVMSGFASGKTIK